MPNSTQQTTTNELIPLVQRELVAQLREIVSTMTPSQNIETAQVLLYQASKRLKSPFQLLVPTKGINQKIFSIFAIAESLPLDTLLELAIEILEAPRDENT